MIIGSILSKAGRQAVDWLFPPRCVVCGSAESFLCLSCRESLPRAELPRCAVCWQPGAVVGLREVRAIAARLRWASVAVRVSGRRQGARARAEVPAPGGARRADGGPSLSLPASTTRCRPTCSCRCRSSRGENAFAATTSRRCLPGRWRDASGWRLMSGRSSGRATPHLRPRRANVEERRVNVRDAFRCRDRRWRESACCSSMTCRRPAPRSMPARGRCWMAAPPRCGRSPLPTRTDGDVWTLGVDGFARERDREDRRCRCRS